MADNTTNAPTYDGSVGRSGNGRTLPTPRTNPVLSLDDGDPADLATLGVEEELHVVDLTTRELVPRAAGGARPARRRHFSAELHRSVVETNTPVCRDPGRPARRDRGGCAGAAVGVAESLGLGLVAAGTVPLVDLDPLPVTPTSRYRRMLDEYQMLAREQLICGAQVHVGVPDRDEAVAVAQRVAPALPVLLALSASSPYWMGEDSGYASVRSLVWLRWPTAGDSGEVTSAADHDALVADLIASGTITDPEMVYFDVRPSAHVPTVELRVTDSSPDADDRRAARRPVPGAGPARARRATAPGSSRTVADRPPVHARRDVAGRPLRARGRPARPAPLARAGARRGRRRPAGRRPAPAAGGARRLGAGLRPVRAGARAAAARRPASAGRRRAAGRSRRRGRPAARRHPGRGDGHRPRRAAVPAGLPPYAGDRRRGVPGRRRRSPRTGGSSTSLSALGPGGLRRREDARDDEQRARGVTFSVAGEAATRLFPFDLVPRIVPAADWRTLRPG